MLPARAIAQPRPGEGIQNDGEKQLETVAMLVHHYWCLLMMIENMIQ